MICCPLIYPPSPPPSISLVTSHCRSVHSCFRLNFNYGCRCNWLAGWLTGWLIDWLADWLTVDWLTDWLKGWLVEWLADYLAECLTGWLADWLTDWMTGWLLGWMSVWLTDWLADWLTGWLTDWLLTDWLTGWRGDWLNDWLKGWLIEWLADCLAECLSGWLTDRSQSWPAGDGPLSSLNTRELQPSWCVIAFCRLSAVSYKTSCLARRLPHSSAIDQITPSSVMFCLSWIAIGCCRALWTDISCFH